MTFSKSKDSSLFSADSKITKNFPSENDSKKNTLNVNQNSFFPQSFTKNENLLHKNNAFNNPKNFYSNKSSKLFFYLFFSL